MERRNTGGVFVRTSTIILGIGLALALGIAAQGPLAKTMTAKPVDPSAVERAKWYDLFDSIEEGIAPQYFTRQVEHAQIQKLATDFHNATTGALRARDYYSHMVDTDEVRVSKNGQQVQLTLLIDASIRLGHINGLEVTFFEQLCTPWLESALGKNGYALRVRMARPDNANIFTQVVSPRTCEQFSGFLERRET
ncbi:MAG: hypothetical protein AAFR51_12380 [Pseudomonadota bacterium]